MISFSAHKARRWTILGLTSLMLLQVFLPTNAVYADARSPLDSWQLLGPIEFSESATPESLADWLENLHIDPAQVTPAGIKIRKKELDWKPAVTEGDGGLDLDEQLGSDAEYASCYAWTSWKVAEAKTAFLDFGSADAARIWLNGEVIFEQGLSPAAGPRSLLPVSLKQGQNVITIKLVNLLGDGWGFGMSALSEDDLVERLISSAWNGNVDEVRKLVEYGVDPNSTVGPDFRAIHAAKIKGREGVAGALMDLGAEETEMPERSAIAEYWIRQELEENEPGITAIIRKGDRNLFEISHGLADVANERPLELNSTFRIGSISKQFTASAILNLTETGLISLNDPVSNYVAGIDERITVRMLLNHTSGLHSYTDDESFIDEVESYIQPEELIVRIVNYEPEFEPGSSWAYCNSGYFLLGQIVEQVSEMSFSDYMQETFFQPLGMQNTGVYVNTGGNISELEALGHQRREDGYGAALNWDMSWAGGAGNLYSNTEDLLRWNEAIFQNKILTEELIKEAHTPARLSNGEVAEARGAEYGLGWMLLDYRGKSIIAHGGGLNGFATYLAYIPALDLHVTVLANSLPGNADPQRIGLTLAEIFESEEFALQESYESVDVDAEILKEYEGRYGYPGGAVMTVRTEEGKLYATLSGQPEYELFANGEDNFYWKVVEARIEFKRDDKGQVSGGVHYQGGAEFEVPKLEEQTTIEVSTKVMKKLSGTYDFRGQDMIISERDGQLFVKLGPQPEYELFPKSGTEWFLKVVDATVSFKLNDKGEATSATLNQGGMTIEAPRK